MNEKAALRRHIRSLDPGGEARQRESAAISARILQSPWYQEARIVGGYMPLAREADITPVLADALHSGRILALPLCTQAPQMTLRRVTSLEELIPGAYGILEPREDTEIIQVDALDLLLVPLEGIDPCGMRLGKGGGYYDCLLADSEITTIGCALSWQWADELPRERWDRALYACADENGLHYFATKDRNERKHQYGNEKESTEDREGHKALHEGRYL